MRAPSPFPRQTGRALAIATRPKVRPARSLAAPAAARRAKANAGGDDDDDPVSSALARLLLTNPSLTPPPRAPSPLLSPGEVARAVLEALQRVDYPTPGAGAATAFAFTLPADRGGAAPLTPGAGRRGQDWRSPATPCWLIHEEWEASVFGSDSLARLVIGADEVEITGPACLGTDGRAAIPFSVVVGRRRSELDLVLSLVDEHGPWKGCYLVAGLRER